MSRDTGAMPQQGRGAGRTLLPIFVRTRGSWWTTAAAALAAAVVVLLHAVTQGLTLSPPQAAREYFGTYDYARTNIARLPLGDNSAMAGLDGALTAAGATAVDTRLFVIDLGKATGGEIAEVRYEERRIGDPGAGTVELVQGRAPTSPGEVCLSPEAKRQAPAATALSFYGDALTLRVTCTAVDDHHRDGVTIFAAPGTWAAAGDGKAAEDLRRWGSEASVNVFWSGGKPAEVARAADALTGDGTETGDYMLDDLGYEDADEMRQRPRTFNAVSNAWVFLAPMILVPLTASAVASWGGTRLLSRSTDTLDALGLRRSRIRRLTVLLPVMLCLIGSVVGLALGIVVGWAGRLGLARLIQQPLGPWVGLPTVMAIVLGMSLLGVLGGILLATLRLSPRLRDDLEWARNGRFPWPSLRLCVGLMALCLLGAILCATDATTMTRRVGAVLLVGLASVLVVTFIVGVVARRGLAQTPGGLVRHRLITSGGGAWLIMLLFGLQAVLTTGAVTMVTSGVQTFNDSLFSSVPADQARLDLLNIEDDALQAALVEQIRDRLGETEDFSYRAFEAGTRFEDGPVLVVETPQEAADLMGLPTLPDDLARQLTAGAAGRSAGVEGGTLVLVDGAAADSASASAVVAELPIVPVEGVQGTLASGGAVILRSVADELEGAPVSVEVERVFPRLTAGQQAVAADLPQTLQFNAEWLNLPKAPDAMEIPDQVTWGAGIVAVLGVVLALIYGVQAGIAGRRVLAGAQAMGLSRAWVRRVLAGQIGWVVLAPAAAGVGGSALGVVAVTTLQGVPVDLHIPWGLVGTMAAGTLLAFVGAVWLALRNLSVRERLG